MSRKKYQIWNISEAAIQKMVSSLRSFESKDLNLNINTTYYFKKLNPSSGVRSDLKFWMQVKHKLLRPKSP